MSDQVNTTQAQGLIELLKEDETIVPAIKDALIMVLEKHIEYANAVKGQSAELDKALKTIEANATATSQLAAAVTNIYDGLEHYRAEFNKSKIFTDLIGLLDDLKIFADKARSYIG